MAYPETITYEQGFVETIGGETEPLFYFFDYDVRSFDINMEFQHFHRFYEIHILLDKEAGHLVDGNLYELQPYDVTLLPPLKLHKSIYPEGDPVKRLIIQFAFPAVKDGLLSNDLQSLLDIFRSDCPVLRMNEADQAVTFSHINKIYGFLKNKPQGYTLQIHSEFIQFLYCLSLFQSKNCYKQTAEDTLEEKIYHVTSYIHAHFAEEMSLDTLAKICYLSPTYLSHQFKAVTGFTLVNYIQMTRISNAQQMLLSSNAKITDISSACGFNSFSQFNRTFNKFVKKSPSEFRRP